MWEQTRQLLSTYQEAQTLLRNKDPSGDGPLETSTSLHTQSSIWHNRNRSLYSGCKQATVACKCTLSKLASWTLHTTIAEYILLNCVVQQKHRLWPQDEATTTKLWATAEDSRRTIQFLDSKSKHGWSTTEEEIAFTEGEWEKNIQVKRKRLFILSPWGAGAEA